MGSGVLNKQGSGTLILAGSSSYTGGTNLQSGILQLGNSAALGAGAVAISSGTLDASQVAASIGPFGMSGGALILSASNLLSSSGTAGFAGTLDIVNTSSITSLPWALMTYAGAPSGPFTGVIGLSSSDSLSYTSGSLEVVANGPASTRYNLTASAAASLLHLGQSTTVTAMITNAGSSGADTLSYTGLNLAASAGSLSSAGLPKNSSSPLALGASESGSLTYTATSAGAISLVPTVSTANNGIGGGSATLNTTTSATINVFGGNGTWAGTGGTATWDTLGSTHWSGSAAPGTFGGFTTSDTAVFNGTDAAQTVSLSNATPSLLSLSFSGANYRLTGGSLTLYGGADVAAISVLGNSSTLIVR